MRAVILAGGKGKRLEPLTTSVPKPLLPVGELPILEIILRQLKHQGFEEIVLAVGHLQELIMAAFGDGKHLGVTITYSREDQPLGTAGCLGLLREILDEPFLMMNGDTLTTLPYAEFFRAHQANRSLATIALTERQVPIDYGVIETDGMDRITGYIEKPILSYRVSMGVYAFQPDVLGYVRPGEVLGFPDLMLRLLAAGEPVRAYPYQGYWLDIGRREDYRRANQEIQGMLPQLLPEGG